MKMCWQLYHSCKEQVIEHEVKIKNKNLHNNSSKNKENKNCLENGL